MSLAFRPARKGRDMVLPLVIGGAVLGLVGFNMLASQFSSSSNPASANGGAHGHTVAHNPNIQSFSDYHLEAQITGSGQIRVFVLDEVAKGAVSLPLPNLEAELQPVGEDPSPVLLEAKPQSGDDLGSSSRFLGQVPESLRARGGVPLGLTVTVAAKSKTFRLHFAPDALQPDAFATASDSSTHTDTAMPTPLAAATTTTSASGPTEAETALFLTPGGIYTEADIAANGRMVASQKFKGLMAKHNMNPASGAPICPITKTAADTRFPWVINGKTYLFCCPPCVEEFVKRAKEQPETVKEPSEYVKG